MTPRTGRPPEDDARRYREYVRLNDEEREKLEYCKREGKKSKAEIIREGIDLIYQRLKNR